MRTTDIPSPAESDVIRAESLRQRYLRNLKREIASMDDQQIDAYTDSALDSDRVVERLSAALNPPTVPRLALSDLGTAYKEAHRDADELPERFDPW